MSVLSGVVHVHSHRAQGCLPGCGLVGKAVVPDNHPDVLFSDHMEIRGKHFSVGDFAARGGELGYLVACCIEGDDLFAIVDVWNKVAEVSQHSTMWDVLVPMRDVWRVADMLEVVAGDRGPSRSILVIHI